MELSDSGVLICSCGILKLNISDAEVLVLYVAVEF
jgi:hypothetical protein